MGRPRFICLLARLHILFARAASMLTAGPKFVLRVRAIPLRKFCVTSLCATTMSLLVTSAGKPHRELHCIAGKLPPWRLSDIQECCSDRRTRLGKTALRLYHTCAQCCAPLQHISRKALLFGGTRACCLRPLAHGCIVFEVLRRKLPRACFSLEQH